RVSNARGWRGWVLCASFVQVRRFPSENPPCALPGASENACDKRCHEYSNLALLRTPARTAPLLSSRKREARAGHVSDRARGIRFETARARARLPLHARLPGGRAPPHGELRLPAHLGRALARSLSADRQSSAREPAHAERARRAQGRARRVERR